MKLSLQLKNIEIIFSVILKSPFIAVNQKLKWICSKPLFPFSFPKIIFTFNTFRSILQLKKKNQSEEVEWKPPTFAGPNLSFYFLGGQITFLPFHCQ